MKRAPLSPWHQLRSVLLGTGLLYLLLASQSAFWRLATPPARLAAYAAAGAAFGWIWYRSGGAALLLTLAGLGGCWAAPLVSKRWSALSARLLNDLTVLGSKLAQGQWNATFSPELGELFLLLLALGSGALILRENLRRGSAFWAAALGALIFGTQWSWFFDRSLRYFIPFLLLAWFMWLLGLNARRQAQWTAAGRAVCGQSSPAAPTAALLAVALLAGLLPANSSPYNLGQLGEEAQRIFPFLSQMRGGAVAAGRFTLARTGFAPSIDALGGPVQLDNSLALELVLTEQPASTIYLRGAAFQTYNGRTWLPGTPKAVQPSASGELPSQMGSGVPWEYRTIEIRPAADFGPTLFNLLEPARVEGYAYEADADGNLLAAEAVAPGGSYAVTSRVPAFSGEQIRTISRSAPSSAYNAYLQVPASVPSRVKTLAQSITARQEHSYDKAVALEAWLRGLEYDLNPPVPPADRDFVDHFLFDTQRGYCTYFSSAMVVMLRQLGVPARLVEGFAVPPGLAGSSDGEGNIVLPVTNSMAHAWVEAYFPEYGWVTFDPTPRGDLPLVDRTHPAPAQEGNEAPAPDASSPNAEPERPEQAEAPTAPAEGDAALPDEGQAPSGILLPLLLLVGAAAALALLGWRRLRRLDSLPAQDAAQTVQQVWVRTESLMDRFGAGRRPHQTPREYAEYLGEQWPALARAAQHLAQDYEQVRFAPPSASVDPGAARRARRFWQHVRDALVDRYGWRGYLWRRLGLPWRRFRRTRKD